MSFPNLPVHRLGLFDRPEDFENPFREIEREIQGFGYTMVKLIKEKCFDDKKSILDSHLLHVRTCLDVGARSYGSSIVSWFKKQYPKQIKTFEIYTIEADKHFHDRSKVQKGGQVVALCRLDEE